MLPTTRLGPLRPILLGVKGSQGFACRCMNGYGDYMLKYKTVSLRVSLDIRSTRVTKRRNDERYLEDEDKESSFLSSPLRPSDKGMTIMPFPVSLQQQKQGLALYNSQAQQRRIETSDNALRSPSCGNARHILALFVLHNECKQSSTTNNSKRVVSVPKPLFPKQTLRCKPSPPKIHAEISSHLSLQRLLDLQIWRLA